MNKQTIPDQILMVVAPKEQNASLWGVKFLAATRTNGPRFKYWETDSKLEARSTPKVVAYTCDSSYLVDQLQEILGNDYRVLHPSEAMFSAWLTYDLGKITK